MNSLVENGRDTTVPPHRLEGSINQRIKESLEVAEDPLSHAQVLSSIKAAKRLHLPTGDALRALRRQIDED